MELNDVIVNQPVVIDNGSGVIKAGFAGDQIPKCRFPNYIGRPKHVRVMAGALEGELFVGPRAEEHRGLLSIKYPMEHGIVTDWNDMERVWNYIYSKDQLSTFSEEHPVLLTEAPLNPRRNREKAAEVFFETFNVPALFLSMQAVLSLYATGRTTGVVLDSGDGVTHAVPHIHIRGVRDAPQHHAGRCGRPGRDPVSERLPQPIDVCNTRGVTSALPTLQKPFYTFLEEPHTVVSREHRYRKLVPQRGRNVVPMYVDELPADDERCDGKMTPSASCQTILLNTSHCTSGRVEHT
ncbi:hypothetical protein evm_013970 [Chilo suppressalis]|nr:hypothetical protein evm_013970 [Chilo suppressalis]